MDQAETHTAERLAALLHGSSDAWFRRVELPGLVAFDIPSQNPTMSPYLLAEGSGVVYGTLFPSGTPRAVSPASLSTDVKFAERCKESRGRALTGEYWGGYIAVIRDAALCSWYVLRDCSGTLPCYYTSISGVSVFVSDIIAVLRLIPAIDINWGYLAAFILDPHLQIGDSALPGVRELLAGECVISSKGRQSTSLAWDPVNICDRVAQSDGPSAASVLRETSEFCVNAWASRFQSVLHSLSGGFDSSLVLAMLLRADTRPRVTCINRFATGPAEDERRYARIVTQFLGTELIETPWMLGARAFDESCLCLPPTPKPTIQYLLGSLDVQFWNEVCDEHRAECVWTGQGGDHLFWAAKTDLGIADCFRTHGIGRELITSIREAVALTGHSYWYALREACSALLSERAGLPATHDSPFLGSDFVSRDLHTYIRHPWYFASKGLPPGKRAQLLGMSDVLNRERPMPGLRSIEEFHPLLSQPILEACLTIPIHTLLSGGKTRGLARQAFTSYLPPEIRCRESKGQTTTYILEILRRSVPFVSQLLFDGRLVRERLVSRVALENVLRHEEPIALRTFFPVFACIAAEVWIACLDGARCGRSTSFQHSHNDSSLAINDTYKPLAAAPIDRAHSAN